MSWCTLCHTAVPTAVPVPRLPVPHVAVPHVPVPDDGPEGAHPDRSPVQTAPSALVGGQVSEQRIAELVAELVVGESRIRGSLLLGAGRSRGARALAAGVGVGLVLVIVLGVLWLAGSLL